MLTRIRESFLGWKAVAVLVILAASFVFFGVNMSFSGAAYVARVNGADITPFDVQEFYQAQVSFYRQQVGEITPELDELLQRNSIEQMITNKVVETYLDDQGFVVSDETVQEAIRTNPTFAENGEFSYELYRSQLAQSGEAPASFERDTRDNLRFGQLRQALETTSFVTPAELRRFIEINYETRTALVGQLPLSTFLAEADPSDEAIAAFYTDNTESFKTPEAATVAYIELTPAAVAEAVTVDDTALQSYFQENAEAYETPPERNPRHILIPIDDDEDAALALATQLYERAAEGEDFAALATEYSKDGGSQSRGGDLGWVRVGQFVGAVDDAVFAMQQGEIRGPVKSEFGFHVIRLDGIREGGRAEFDDVRVDIERDYRAQQAVDQFERRSDELANALFDNPELASLAQSQNLEVKRIDEFTRSSAGVFLNDDAVLDAVFGENAVRGDDLSDTLQLSDQRLIVLQVSEYRESATRPQSDVRDQIIAELKRQQAEVAQTATANEIISSQGDAEQFEAAIVAAGGTYDGERSSRRQGSGLDQALVDALFAVARDQSLPYSGSVTGGSDIRWVYHLRAIAQGNPADVPDAEKNQLRARLAQQSGAADLRDFVTALRDDATIKIGAAAVQSTNDF